MSYGVFQEYFTEKWTFEGDLSTTGIIGTTSNGVMYLSIPFLFALFARRFARYRRTAAFAGALFSCLSFLLSAFSTDVWHLVVTQGVLAALGCALVYSPTTLSLGEWFGTSNRALAYGVTLSCKNIVGSVCPFLFRALLVRWGFRDAMLVWTGIVAGSGLLAIALIAPHPSCFPTVDDENGGRRTAPKLPWSFLRHQMFWVYSTAIMLQSAGYGIPQTYLNTFAHDVTLLSSNSATLLLTIFNVPGIAAGAFFGYLSDNRHVRLSSAAVTAISATSSALSALLFWGLAAQGSMALLVLFASTFGFFAGGYSATWGGVVNEMEREASRRNEAIDTGMVYGLLNGARGVGYVAGGVAGVPLRSGAGIPGALFAYGSSYGPLIVFTGLSVAFGGWGLAWKVGCAARERVRGVGSGRIARVRGWVSSRWWAI
jgi:MFS family permease